MKAIERTQWDKRQGQKSGTRTHADRGRFMNKEKMKCEI
jgi:hypothetical protein